MFLDEILSYGGWRILQRCGEMCMCMVHILLQTCGWPQRFVGALNIEKKKSLFGKSPIFYKALLQKKPGNLGRSQIVAAPSSFCKDVDGGWYIAEMQMDGDIIYHISYMIYNISYRIFII